MYTKSPYQAYAAANHTVGKVRQIVLLYDGAIRFVQQAIEAIREKRIEDRYNLLNRAAQIIAGLQDCLDGENGGEIAVILDSFYTSLYVKIFSIQRTNSIQDAEQVIRALREMRQAWDEIDRNSAAAQSSRPNGEAQAGMLSAPDPKAPMAEPGSLSATA